MSNNHRVNTALALLFVGAVWLSIALGVILLATLANLMFGGA